MRSKPAETFLGGGRYWPGAAVARRGKTQVSECDRRLQRHYRPYLPPSSSRKAGVEFKPEESAYAGTRESGWQAVQGPRALPPGTGAGGGLRPAPDHDHIRQFTDRLAPPIAPHSTPINDAIVVNPRVQRGSPELRNLPPSGLLIPLANRHRRPCCALADQALSTMPGRLP